MVEHAQVCREALRGLPHDIRTSKPLHIAEGAMKINNNTTMGSAATLAGRLCHPGFHAAAVAAPVPATVPRQSEANGGTGVTIPVTFDEAIDQMVTEVAFPRTPSISPAAGQWAGIFPR